MREDIIVSGIRAGLQDAERSKRNADVILDGIAADDIGDLPDVSISETLVRLPGVTANDNGAVSIRGLGPDLLTIQYNGRILPTSDNQTRRVQLGALPTEGVARAYVQKTSTADAIEGGVAGVLALESIRPLEARNEGLTLAARGVVNTNSAELSEAEGFADVSPRVSASFVKRLASNFGVAVTYAYISQYNSLRQNDIGGWRLGNGTRTDVNGDGTPDALPSTVGVNVNYNNDFRHAVVSTVQWEPVPAIRITADGFYNTDLFKSETRRYMAANLFNGANGALSSSHVNEYNVVDQFTGNAGMYRGVVNNVRGRDTTFQGGLNVAVDDGGPLKAVFDASYSEGRRKRRTGIITYENDAANANAQRTAFSYDISDPYNPVYSFQQLTADDFSVSQIQYQPGRARETIKAARADFEYAFPSGWAIKGIDFGVRVDSRHHTNRTANVNYIFATNPSLRPDIDSSYLLEETNPLSGTGNALLGGASSLTFPWYDYEKLMTLTADSRATVNTLYGNNLANAVNVREDSYALYAQADFDLGPLTGNFGGRYLITDSTVRGQQGSSAANVVDLTYKQSYRYFLPSINLRYELAPGLIVRTAASKTISRPKWGDMAVGAAVDLTSTPTSGVVTITQGNPQLKPFTSTGLDLSLEWYPSSSTSIGVQGFVKYVKNFLVSADQASTATLVDGTVLPAIITTTINDPKKRNFRGLEVIVRQQLDFLPGFLGNLGVQGNWSHTVSNGEETITSLVGSTAVVAPNNYSRDILNAQVFYGSPGVNLRVAYRKYTTASRTVAGTIQNLPTGLFDFTSAIKVREGVRLIGSVTNIFNRSSRQYIPDYRNADNDTLNVSMNNNGRTFALGLRANF